MEFDRAAGLEVEGASDGESSWGARDDEERRRSWGSRRRQARACRRLSRSHQQRWWLEEEGVREMKSRGGGRVKGDERFHKIRGLDL